MAQTITATELATTAIANVRRVSHKIQFMWDGSNYTPETSYCQSWEAEHQSANPGAGIATIGNSMAARAGIVLRNESGRFSQLLTTGALYANIGNGKMCLAKANIQAGFLNSGNAAELLNQFTGYIVGATEDKQAGTITLECDDMSAMLRNRRVSTIVYAPRSPVTYDGSPGAYIQLVIDAVNTDLPAGRQISTSLDAGRFGLDYAWCEDEDAWEEIKKVAEADGGRLYFDHSGVLHYEDASHLLLNTHASPTFSMTVANFADLTHSWQWQQPPANHIIVHVNPRYVAPLEEIYICGENLQVKPGATLTHKAEFRNAAWDVLDPVANTDYVAITPGGMDKTSSLTVTATATSKKATFTIVNNHAYETLILHHLQLRGRPVLMKQVDKVEVTDDDSIAQYGKITMEVDNPMIQGRKHGETIANMQLARLKTPIQATTITNVPCIPWLELGDRLTVVDANSGTNHAMYIVGDIRGIDASDPGNAVFTQRALTLLPAGNLWPRTDYFEVARTALGTTGGKYFW